MDTIHKPVLLDKVLEYLEPKAGENFIDCTVGGGGYTLALFDKAGKKGRIFGLDLDEKALARTEKRLNKEGADNVELIKGNFADLTKLIEAHRGKKGTFAGIVFDLGLSSDQLEDKQRSFSFKGDRPLDMSFSGKGITEDIINNYSEKDLEDIIKNYGEERFAKRIADNIVKNRQKEEIRTSGQLKEIIAQAVPKGYYKKIDPATKTFQALRIASNDELSSLRKALPQATELLKESGRVAVISYHSLEDRIVKNYFRQESKDCICPPDNWICDCEHSAQLKILTKKVVVPSEKEIADNPRARSAKLRVAEKVLRIKYL
jgi:16S rRNA (cytosine1402-N4)-methyltransferase